MKNLYILVSVLLCIIIIAPLSINSCGGAMRMVFVKTDPPPDDNDPIELPDFQVSPVLVLLRDTSNNPIGFEINWGKLDSKYIKGYQFRRDTATIANDLVSTSGKIIKVATSQGGAVNQLFPQPTDSTTTKLKAYDMFNVEVGKTYYYRVSYITTSDKESKLSPEVNYSISNAVITGVDNELAGAGDTITLSGSDFGELFNQNTCRVIFKGVKPIWHQGLVPAEYDGEIVSWGNDKVVVKVPFGAISGTVRLMVQNYSTDSTFELLIKDPYITSIANDGGFPYPDMGTEDTTMILKGKNFGSPGSTPVEVRLNGNLLSPDLKLVTLVSSEELHIKLPTWNETQKPDIYDQFMSIKFNNKDANQPLLDYNCKPVIKFTTDKSAGPHPLDVTFDGTKSYDPDSSSFELSWAFGDPEFTTKDYRLKSQHVYKRIGTYNVLISAVDIEGAKSFDKTTINVTPATTQGAWSQFAHDVSNTNSTTAIGPATGTLKWIYQVTDKVYSSPVLADDGSVYFGCMDGNLYALDKNGALKWQFNTGSKIAYSTPAVSTNGSVYIGATDGYLYAINDDGTLNWKFNSGGEIWSSSPAVDNLDNVYIGSRSNTIYMLDNKGDLIASYTGKNDDCDSKVGVTPDGQIVFGNINKTIVLLTKNAGLTWDRPLSDQNFLSAPSITSSKRFIIGSNSGNVQCFGEDGYEVWNYQANTKVTSTIAQGISNGMSYFGDYDGQLHAVRDNGSMVWKYNSGSTIVSSPITDGTNNIYFGNKNGEFFSIDSEGNLNWKFAANGSIHGSPAMGTDGSVYFTTEAGFVYCLGPGPTQVGLMPPTSVKATDGTLVEQVEVTWVAPTTGPAPDKYWIYRAETQTGAYSKIGESTTTSFINIVKKSQIYWYKVKSVKNDFNFSGFSNIDSGYIAKLEKPENLSATEGTDITKVFVSWLPPNKGPLPGGYEIFRSPTKDGTYELIGSTSNLLFDDEPTPFEFWYKVRATKPDYENGPFTDPVKGYIAKLQPPVDVTASDQEFIGEIHISWKAPASGPVPDSYDIYRSAYISGQEPVFWLITAGVEGLSYIDNPTDGKIYTYALKSTKKYYDSSQMSSADNGQNKLLSPPTDVIASDGLYSDKIKITWKAPEDGPKPERYLVYRSDKQFGTYQIVDYIFNSTTFYDLTVPDSNKYWYSVVSQLKNYPDSGFSQNDDGYMFGINTTIFEETGQSTDITSAILKDGIPGVAYYDQLNEELKFGCSKVPYPKNVDDWDISVIDADIKGRFPSIFLNDELKPIVAYYDSENMDLKFAESSVVYPTSSDDWTWHTVHTNGDSGASPSMILDNQLRPVIVYKYRGDKIDDLKISEAYTQHPTSSGDWNTYVFTTAGVVEGNPSLSMLHDGSLVFAYTDSTPSVKIKYTPTPSFGGLGVQGFAAGSWTTCVVSQGGNYGSTPSCAVNGQGLPVVAFANNTNSNINLAEAEISKPTDASDWNIYDVSPKDSVTENPSLVILPDLTYAVGYTQFTDNSVGYYQSDSSDLSTTNWKNVSLDTGVSNMYLVSLKHLVNGQPFISYLQAGTDTIPKLRYIDKADVRFGPLPPTDVQASDGEYYDVIQITWVYPTIGIRPYEFILNKSDAEMGEYNIYGTYPSTYYSVFDTSFYNPQYSKTRNRRNALGEPELWWYKIQPTCGFTPDILGGISNIDSGYVNQMMPMK